MTPEDAGRILRESRLAHGLSLRVVADAAGVRPSVASRAERGHDARLSTWIRLFEAAGYDFGFALEKSEAEGSEIPFEENVRRRERRTEGLCTGKRRW